MRTYIEIISNGFVSFQEFLSRWFVVTVRHVLIEISFLKQNIANAINIKIFTFLPFCLNFRYEKGMHFAFNWFYLALKGDSKHRRF